MHVSATRIKCSKWKQFEQNKKDWHKHTYHRQHYIMRFRFWKISKTMLICNGNSVYTAQNRHRFNLYKHMHAQTWRENRHTYHALFNVFSCRMLVIVLMIYCYCLPGCRSLPANTTGTKILAEWKRGRERERERKKLRVRIYNSHLKFISYISWNVYVSDVCVCVFELNLWPMLQKSFIVEMSECLSRIR